MLILAKSMEELSFSDLMEVYRESCRENGQEFWPGESPERQLTLAQRDFYEYLSGGFFCGQGAVYAIWQADGRYVSALRLEPYRDGLLLEALETRPDCRRCGYARQLIQAVMGQYSAEKIYSHVGKRNTASLGIHEACGFRRILEYAVYADGTVHDRCCTMCYG